MDKEREWGTLKLYQCERCPKKFTSRGSRVKFCPACREIKRTEYRRRSEAKHRAARNERQRPRARARWKKKQAIIHEAWERFRYAFCLRCEQRYPRQDIRQKYCEACGGPRAEQRRVEVREYNKEYGRKRSEKQRGGRGGGAGAAGP